MAVDYLRKYNLKEKASAFNAPHKYRFALKRNLDESIIKLIIDAWNAEKNKVFVALANKVKKIVLNSNFAFALAPSRTGLFVGEIEAYFVKTFPNAINLTNCFHKNNFSAAEKTNALSVAELGMYFNVDTDCVKKVKEVQYLLLIDDVYSTGNTLNGMEAAIKEFSENLQIFQIVILKTT